MPRNTIVENLCDACGLGVGFIDDSEETGSGLLEAGETDNGLPPWWGELTLKIKQPNPERVEMEAAEVQLQQEIAKALPAVLKNAEKEKGSKITKAEIEEIRGVMEMKARSDAGMDDDPEDMPAFTIHELKVILCHEHLPLVKGLGVFLQELVLEGNRAPWGVEGEGMEAEDGTEEGEGAEEEPSDDGATADGLDDSAEAEESEAPHAG